MIRVWPFGDSAELHLPIGTSVEVSWNLTDLSGATIAVSGASYAWAFKNKLARTLVVSGAATTDPDTGEIYWTMSGEDTGLFSERRHYYWTLTDVVADVLVLEGPVYPHLEGNWPQSAYRGRVVKSRLNSIVG